MPPVGFVSTIPATERLQTYALERAATGTGILYKYGIYSYLSSCLLVSPFAFCIYFCRGLPRYLYCAVIAKYIYILLLSVPVATRSKGYVCGLSPAEILISNPTGGMGVCLLCVVR